MRDEFTSVIVTKCGACGDVAIECSARCTNRLTKRVDRFVPRAALSSTRLKTLAGAVIDHDEDYCAALICHARSAVYSPHLIWLLRHDCSVVCARLRG